MPATQVSESPVRPNEDELVRKHLPLVHYTVAEIAGRIPRHVTRDDLLSAGMAGLAQAARSFDPERGITFQRFASSRIRGALLDELRSRDWASRSVRSKARRLSSASDRLSATLGRQPSPTELAEAIGMTVEEIDAINNDVHRAVVLNFESLPVEGSPEDLIPSPEGQSPADIVLAHERHAYLVAAVANLPERLRHVVIGYFFEERPMQELAEELGVTDSRISQMRAEALLLMKDGINAHLDPELVVEDQTSPRVAKRKSAYFSAIGTYHDYRSRLDPASGSLASMHAATA